jgi:hypothetical protein
MHHFYLEFSSRHTSKVNYVMGLPISAQPVDLVSIVSSCKRCTCAPIDWTNDPASFDRSAPGKISHCLFVPLKDCGVDCISREPTNLETPDWSFERNVFQFRLIMLHFGGNPPISRGRICNEYEYRLITLHLGWFSLWEVLDQWCNVGDLVSRWYAKYFWAVSSVYVDLVEVMIFSFQSSGDTGG